VPEVIVAHYKDTKMLINIVLDRLLL